MREYDSWEEEDKEPERPALDVYRMYPEAAKRVELLEKIRRSWQDIVGQRLAPFCVAYSLGVDELCIFVHDENAARRLKQMKGTIARKINRIFGHKFNVTILRKLPVVEKPVDPKPYPKPRKIIVSEERVRQLMESAPDSLPEDINYAIAHLWAFLEQNPKPVPKRK